MVVDLKILSAYLPYRLNFLRYEKLCLDSSVTPVIWSKDLHPVKTQLNAVNLNNFDYNTSKLILRPISELEKDKKFSELYFSFYCTTEGLMLKRKNETYTRLEELFYLFENHYDVFGLIEKGLAVDINTLS